mmetsp:Transcript_6637/g.15902  ORF Transcript_6637/g.15902 Transcript_6637/m.15902 type:complete len:353 (+) Transcript_6637:1528-2586(+)
MRPHLAVSLGLQDHRLNQTVRQAANPEHPVLHRLVKLIQYEHRYPLLHRGLQPHVQPQPVVCGPRTQRGEPRDQLIIARLGGKIQAEFTWVQIDGHLPLGICAQIPLGTLPVGNNKVNTPQGCLPRYHRRVKDSVGGLVVLRTARVVAKKSHAQRNACHSLHRGDHLLCIWPSLSLDFREHQSCVERSAGRHSLSESSVVDIQLSWSVKEPHLHGPQLGTASPFVDLRFNLLHLQLAIKKAGNCLGQLLGDGQVLAFIVADRSAMGVALVAPFNHNEAGVIRRQRRRQRVRLCDSAGIGLAPDGVRLARGARAVPRHGRGPGGRGHLGDIMRHRSGHGLSAARVTSVAALTP